MPRFLYLSEHGIAKYWVLDLGATWEAWEAPRYNLPMRIDAAKHEMLRKQWLALREIETACESRRQARPKKYRQPQPRISPSTPQLGNGPKSYSEWVCLMRDTARPLGFFLPQPDIIRFPLPKLNEKILPGIAGNTITETSAGSAWRGEMRNHWQKPCYIELDRVATVRFLYASILHKAQVNFLRNKALITRSES
jgi:hypothetical protein